MPDVGFSDNRRGCGLTRGRKIEIGRCKIFRFVVAVR